MIFFILARVAGGATAEALSMAKARSDLLKGFMSKMVRRTVFFVGFVVALSMVASAVTVGYLH